MEINGARSIKNVFTKQHVKATRKPIKQSLANFASIQVCNKVFASLVTAVSNEGLLASKQGQKFSVARLHLFLHSIFFHAWWYVVVILSLQLKLVSCWCRDQHWWVWCVLLFRYQTNEMMVHWFLPRESMRAPIQRANHNSNWLHRMFNCRSDYN